MPWPWRSAWPVLAARARRARVPVIYVNDNFGRCRALLLRYLEANTLVLAGLTGDRCVLFSASDAFMRDFRLWIPADCVASLDPERNRRALDEMARLLDADLTESTRLALSSSRVRRRGREATARARSAPARAAPPARRSHAPAA